MVARWTLAFSVAAVVSMGGASVLRAASRRGAVGIRRRGALTVAGGALCGGLLLPTLSARIAVIALASLALAAYAVVFVLRPAPRGSRLIVLTGAALAAAAFGVRLEWTGVAALDVAGTVGFIVAVASGLRWADAIEGLSATTGAVIATGVFALAAFGDQGALAVLAAATGGACVGFLAYGLPPASVELNRDGALFVGYLVAVVAVEVRPSIGVPGSLVVPLLLTAVPLLEIALVPLGQARHRNRLDPERRDHLVHRLAALGIPRWAAVTVLLGTQLALAGVAVFVGRGVVAPTWGLAAGVAAAAAVVVAATVKGVYPAATRGFSARVKLVGLGVVALLVLLALPAAVAAARARQSVENARARVEQALDAARAGEARAAGEHFAAAASAFEDAHSTLTNPLVSTGLVVPIVGPNLRATRDIARIGADLARTGERTSARVDPDRLEVVEGTVPLAEVERVTPDLAQAARQLRRAVRHLDEIDDPFLLAPVRDALDEVDRELTVAADEADNAVAAARLAPAIFGGEAPRRYFLAVQNPAEQRATGGFIGQWGILTAQGGKVELERIDGIAELNPGPGEERTLSASDDYAARYERFAPQRTWQNINMSPDFRTVARVIADQYRQATGEQIDGVLAVDPQGLAALLELTGEVSVAPWPEPITADNVVDVTLRDVYVAFDGQDEQRDQFLEDVAEAVVDRATEVELGSPAEIARVLGRAAAEGHVILAFADNEEEALASELEVAGRVPPVRSDSLLVTAQNAAANKIDYYLRRRVDYAVRLVPDADAHEALVQGRAEVNLENTAPDAGLPRYVIGPYDERFMAGENRSFVSVYSPFGFSNATFDGEEQLLEATTELDRNVYAAFLSIPASSSRALALDLTGSVRLEPGGWYTLEVLRQPGVVPDTVRVTVEVPSGWRIAETEGLERTGSKKATARFELDETTRLRVRLEPDRSIWRQLLDGA